jgi:hypothetical protein
MGILNIYLIFLCQKPNGGQELYNLFLLYRYSYLTLDTVIHFRFFVTGSCLNVPQSQEEVTKII